MALYRFLFAPVLLAVAVAFGEGGEPSAPAAPAEVRAVSSPAVPAPPQEPLAQPHAGAPRAPVTR